MAYLHNYNSAVDKSTIYKISNFIQINAKLFLWNNLYNIMCIASIKHNLQGG